MLFKHNKQNNQLNYIFLLLLLLSAFLLNIAIGSVSIPLPEILNSLLGGTSSKSSWDTIIWNFRIPQALTAILAGISLSISGLLMQTLFQNPIAGPFVLGISSGSSLGVAILIMASGVVQTFFPIQTLNHWTLVIFAIGGAFLVLMLVLSISWRVRDVATLLIVGLMLGSATGAIVTILQYFSSQEALKHFVLWSFGSLSGVTWADMIILFPLIIISCIFSFTLSKSLNVLLLGEDYARSMGLNILKTRYIVIIITAILAGSITAFCGPIAFIGIAVPHIARMIFQTQNHRTLLPATALLGAIILLICMLISQLPFSDKVLPINAVTSIMGAPLVIWIVLTRKRV